MTDGIRSAMQEMTGAYVPGCPWRAFAHPLVGEVMRAVQFFESGNMSFAIVDPSARLVEGIRAWNSAYSRMHSKQLEIDRKQAEQDRARDRAQPPPGIRNRRRR